MTHYGGQMGEEEGLQEIMEGFLLGELKALSS